MRAHHEHEFEAAPGLPEALPVGEHIIWQGSPDVHALASHVYHMRQLAPYFAAMVALQGLLIAGEPQGFAFRPLLISCLLAFLALGLLYAVAVFTVRNTLYTLTNKRVVMRVGIVLTITLNLPYRQIATASVVQFGNGFGDIALDLGGDDRIGWLHLWPHARPWVINKPQPSLRCLADVKQVAEILQAAWCAANPGVMVRLGDIPNVCATGTAALSKHGSITT